MPKKLNALINIHEELDLSSFAFVNAPPAGKLLGEDVKPAYSEENLATLISMGLNVNAAKRALIATKDNIEAVFDWIANNS